MAITPRILTRARTDCYLALCLVPGLLLANGLGAGDPEPKMLLTPVNVKAALNEKQAKALDRIKKADTTVHVEVFRLHVDALADGKTPLTLLLPGDETLSLNNYELTKDGGVTKLSWAAESKNPSVHLTVVPKDKAAIGMIYSGNKVFKVEPLGNDLIAVIHLNQAKFVDEPRR